MNEPEMNVTGRAAVDLHDARAGPSRLQGGIFSRFDPDGASLTAASFEDNRDLLVASSENGMNRRIAIHRQISIFLRPIEAWTLRHGDAVDGDDMFPGLDAGQRGRTRFENEGGEELVGDPHELKTKAGLRLAAQLSDQITETLFREKAEMRRRNMSEQFFGDGPLRLEIGGRSGSRPIFQDQGRELFFAEFFVVIPLAQNGGDAVEDGRRRRGRTWRGGQGGGGDHKETGKENGVATGH